MWPLLPHSTPVTAGGQAIFRVLPGILLLLATSGAAPLSAQQVTSLIEGCTDCRIVFDTVAILGEPQGPGMLHDEAVELAVDDRGRYFVLSDTGSTVKVFSSDGAFLTAVGGRGDGPGEIQMARTIHVEPDGTLFVPDRILARVSVFDPDLALERTVAVDEPRLLGFSILPMPEDAFLVAGHSLEPELVGYAAHLLSSDGARVRSFGEKTYTVGSRDPFYHERDVAPADPDRLWIAGWDRYQIELWTLAGERLAIYERDPDWFTRPARAPDGTVAPRPTLRSVQQDPSGLLWVGLRIAADDWMDGPYRSDFVLEVIDPDSGEWLLSHRESGRFSNLFGDRLVGRTVVEEGEAAARILVLKMELETP